MTTYTIPTGNWTTALADALDKAEDGDTIAVHSEAMKELAERAIRRRTDGKRLHIVIEPPPSSTPPRSRRFALLP